VEHVDVRRKERRHEERREQFEERHKALQTRVQVQPSHRSWTRRKSPFPLPDSGFHSTSNGQGTSLSQISYSRSRAMSVLTNLCR
jgi:hypothetical protein